MTEPPSFTCPDCGSVSYHPEDVAHEYCGRCHAFVGKARQRPAAVDVAIAVVVAGIGAGYGLPWGWVVALTVAALLYLHTDAPGER